MVSTCLNGQTGPDRNYPGFGGQGSALAGFNHLTGWPDREPLGPYGTITDSLSPRFVALLVASALLHRRRTGQGQYIDLAQYETGLQFVTPALLSEQLDERPLRRDGNRDPLAAPHGAYPCSGDDQWCAIAVFGDEEWQAFCAATGHADWQRDARFATHAARKRHEDELDRLVGGWTRTRTPHEVMQALQAAGVRAGAVNHLKDLFCDPQLKHRNVWRELEHAELGSFFYEAPPYNLLETPAELRPSPLLGEHNHQVFGELFGLSEAEIEQLAKDGVIE
jgi:crotonobetainyl-CoA:carnitine CoA-transferase CaiB-like acyl-CoA transferase